MTANRAIGVIARSWLLASTLALAACPSTPPQTAGPNADRLAAQAAAAEQRGSPQQAAALYAQAAAAAAGTARARYALEAARLELDAGNVATATRLLGDARSAGDREQQQLATVLLARAELLQGRAEQALALLDNLGRPLPQSVMIEAAAVRGQALFRLERYTEAVTVLAEREVWLDDGAAVLANQRMIWEGLQRYRASAPPPPTGDPIVDGWLALAPLASRALDPDELRRELLAWRETYRDHPGGRGLLRELIGTPQAGGAFPRQVALLLPLSSPQRDLARAVRDGFLAAHLRSGNASSSRVLVYDTALLGGREAYERAQLEGAEFIVGPLLRPNVEQIVPAAGLVPTLALNTTTADTATTPGFYQFALLPEHEARAVARYAVANGARTAIAIVASTDGGYRQLNAFRDEFELLGGRLLDWSGYDPAMQDFSAPITALLNITRSNRRRERLAANLRVPLEFEPRRRQDVDMVFLGVEDARAGRLLAPQLRFHGAGDIPTYATSEIYEPGDPTRDNDLNGVIFADGQWLLQPDADGTGVPRDLARFWPRANSWLLRFYAMGFDAHRLVATLYDPSLTAWPVRGATGDLVLDSEGRIDRLLPLGQFRAGRPVALDGGNPVVPARATGELARFR